MKHGAGQSQGLWMLTVLASTFFENGREIAHTLSKGYPTYTPEETDTMYDRKLKEREEKGLGWPGCKAFEDAGCKLCSTCMHKGKIKTPLHLTRAAPPANDCSDGTQRATQQGWDRAALTVSFSNIPHRRWLYSTYLIRGEVTVLAAPGGAGKTALATGIARRDCSRQAETRRETLGPGAQKVLYLNGEDSSAEITRRLCGFCQQHQLTEQDLVGLYVAAADDARVQSLSFLRVSDKNATALNESAFGVLEAALQSLRPDLLVLDPLVVFCGGGNMNDNAVMSLVMRKLKALAVKYDCAILIVHHTRKGGRGATRRGTPRAISGAAAIVNLARRALMPATMTDAEAKEFAFCHLSDFNTSS